MIVKTGVLGRQERLLDDRLDQPAPRELPLASPSFFRGFDEHELRDIAPMLERHQYRPRQMIVQKGDPAEELYLLVHGEVSVLVDAPDGTMRRIATMGIGTCFGEPAMLVDGGPRTAWVRADAPTVCWTMHRDVFQALGASQPTVKIRLLENLIALRIATTLVGLAGAVAFALAVGSDDELVPFVNFHSPA